MRKYDMCPYCRKSFAAFGDEFARKHIERCRRRLNPYVYSDRPRGRPTNKEIQKVLDEREGQQDL